MAFPLENFFFERVFEIWTLQQTAKSLETLGAQLIAGPRSLQVRLDSPIYEFKWGEVPIEVWFQRSLPSPLASWRYAHSGQSLRGSPDVTITSANRSPMLIDAKHRLAATRTRSEETYKMLGYLENFRSALEKPSYSACLVFLSNDDLLTILEDSSGRGFVHLLGAHTTDGSSCSLHENLTKAIRLWLPGSEPSLQAPALSSTPDEISHNRPTSEPH